MTIVELMYLSESKAMSIQGLRWQHAEWIIKEGVSMKVP